MMARRQGEIVPRMMNIERTYDLMNELDRMFEDMNSWFWGPRLVRRTWTTDEGIRIPRINLKDQGDSIVVTAEMPGITKDDLEINIHDNVLEIHAEKKDEVKEEDKEGYLYREVCHTAYHRQIPLTEEVIPDKSKAELKDGMLTVSLKKAKEEKPKKHRIQVK